MIKRLVLILALVGSSILIADNHAPTPITEKEVLEFQAKWGESIVAIGDAHTKGDDYKALASNVIDTMYAYDDGGVLFKPTKALEDQFRETKEQALSYFVGGDIKEDKGFAINPWTNVRFENHNIITDLDSATVMGNYYFTDAKTKEEVMVEFTFGLTRAEDGRVVANLHHSSLPYPASN